MALDRQTIEKRDFPVGRRGYEIAAVDAHLQMLADEFEALRHAAQRPAARQDPSLAQSASEQVRMIVEAAEQSAADIRREAEHEAREVREEAGRQARGHVETVSEAARSMLERVETMQRELAELTETLRSGTSKVNTHLSVLAASVEEVGAASPAGPSLEAEPAPVAELPAAEPEPEPEPEPEAPAAGPEPADANGGAGGADEEGARLIALNMALNGSPRDETERYLADNFELADPQGLLDDVYARAGQ